MRSGSEEVPQSERREKKRRKKEEKKNGEREREKKESALFASAGEIRPLPMSRGTCVSISGKPPCAWQGSEQPVSETRGPLKADTCETLLETPWRGGAT
ncbi:hypothetical protein CEXT_33711 [Caerostris extrusa]|uniref:Uncharacterized protein n=1 Tax=Caerostris extrusa TaxID=172846 RepID=A0AAV4PQ10_CAEEX|nr:hypothetical protein CEXT_33711 [Caerostris extrusa]